MSDWLNELSNNAKQQKDRAVSQFFEVKSKVTASANAATAAWTSLSNAQQQGNDALRQLQEVDIDGSKAAARRRKNTIVLIQVIGGVVIIGGASYYFYRRYQIYEMRKKRDTAYFQPADETQSTGQRILGAIKAPFAAITAFATGSSSSSSSSSSFCPPSSADSSAAASAAPTPLRGLLHRTSRSISQAWDSMRPSFGQGSPNAGGAYTRFFSMFSRSGKRIKDRAAVTYLELYLPYSEIAPKQKQVEGSSGASINLSLSHSHIVNQLRLIEEALVHTTEHLYIGLVTDVRSLHLDDLNELLGFYYNAVAGLAYHTAGKPINFAFTFVLPVPNNAPTTVSSLISSVRSRVAALPDLALLLFAPNSSDAQRNQMQLEMGKIRNAKQLVPLRETILEVHVSSSFSSTASTAAFSSSSSSTSSSSFSSPNTVYISGSNRFSTYEHVVLGGTFDHLHIGHKILLTAAALLTTKSLVIGLTSEEMLVKKKFKEQLESWQARFNSCFAFIHLMKPAIEVDIVPLHDMYGPSGDRNYLQCLVVSEETASGGPLVNQKRASNGLLPLDIVIVKLAESGAQAVSAGVPADKVSSTTLREYDANRLERQKTFLNQHWVALCKAVSASGDAVQSGLDLLSHRYSESHRSYHTLNHIEAMLGLWDQSVAQESINHPSEVQLAIWFHDVIYETPSSASTNTNGSSSSSLGTSSVTSPSAREAAVQHGSNERASADLFVEWATGAGVKSDTIDRVRLMILATIRHQLPTEEEVSQQAPRVKRDESFMNDCKYFLDFDLSILGESEAVYQRYTASIRTEYIHLPYDEFLRGRVSVMQNFLQRPVLYFSTEFQARLEAKARFNIKSEIQKIIALPEYQLHSTM